MFYSAMLLFIAALAAGLVGFGGVASALAGVAQLAFFIFIAASVILGAVMLSNDR